ncbi:MAG TPA: tRNA 4-thiouridine(8) synthase ThiI [Candidatus Nanoarchaeia archaeon]|nr:tRNA 4-thiouridine(8) synthase ThiI [Candidatus Nanoarchaeia archaeon]
MQKHKKKCIVMFSGGLDSRLVIKIMQEQGFEVLALYFKLPVGGGCGCNNKEIINFCKKNKTKLKIIDCTKGKNLREYWKTVKNPKYWRGQGVNPCIDCRSFILKKAKKIADKKRIQTIVTGEVLEERPLSQKKDRMQKITKESGLKGRILRPLSAKELKPTEIEKKGLVKREEFYDIKGRKREKQERLAKKFNITYPQPAGGCLLCEKNLKKRFEFLFERGIKEREIPLLNTGRHFIINNYWIVIGRNKKENKIIESIKKGKKIKAKSIKGIKKGPTAIILKPLDKRKKRKKKEMINKTKEIIQTYSKKENNKEKEKFEKYRI